MQEDTYLAKNLKSFTDTQEPRHGLQLRNPGYQLLAVVGRIMPTPQDAHVQMPRTYKYMAEGAVQM